MPEHARRNAELFDQFEDEHRIADWGGDQLFTRMPSRRPLTLVEPPADRAGAASPRTARTGEEAMRERAERVGLSLVEPTHRFDETGALIEPEPAGRPTKVITGHPAGAPRPLPTMRSERRRPARTPAEWVGPRPERLVAWAFALGLVLILIAIITAS